MSRILKVRDWLRNENQLKFMSEKRRAIIEAWEKSGLLEGIRGQNLMKNYEPQQSTIIKRDK